MNTSLLERVRVGLLWSAVQNWGVRLSSLLIFMVAARLMTADQLGLFAVATVVITFFNMLAEQGLGDAVVQRAHVTSEQMNTVFWVNMLAALTMVAIIWLTAPQIAAVMKVDELTPVLRVASLSMPVSAAAFGQLAMRKRAFGYRWIATSTLASTIVGTAAAIALLLAGFGVWGLVAQLLIGNVVLLGMLWLKPAWRLTRQTDLRGIQPLIGYGASRLGTRVLDFANTRYIEIFLATTLGPAMLAVYTVGLKLHQAMMQLLSSTILDVAHSGFSRLANDRPNLISAYYRSISLSATVALPAFMMVAAMAPSLTVVLFGQKWLASADVMRWMSILGAVQVIQFYNGTVYNAIGRPEIGLKFLVVKVFLTFIALALARNGDMKDLMYAYILSQLATTPISFYLVRRLIGISLLEVGRRIWPMLVASILLALTATTTQNAMHDKDIPTPMILISGIITGIAAYVLTLFLVAPQILRDTLQLIRPQKNSS